MPYSRQVLFVVAHPYLERSRANRRIVEAVEGLNGVHVHRLYHLYPEFHIPVAREQELLIKSDLVVVQHPFYWYSMPPLLKQWLDDVFESGFAYGPGGNKLAGKDFLVSITTGGREEDYQPEGFQKHTIEALLAPWRQTAGLCGMNWHRPRIAYGAIRATDDALKDHGLKMRQLLSAYVESGELE